MLRKIRLVGKIGNNTIYYDREGNLVLPAGRDVIAAHEKAVSKNEGFLHYWSHPWQFEHERKVLRNEPGNDFGFGWDRTTKFMSQNRAREADKRRMAQPEEGIMVGSGSTERLEGNAALDAIEEHISLTDHELNVLAYTLLGEAGGEGRAGMEAVMHVIKNRSESGRWSANPATVALQSSKSGYHQFSTWNTRDKGGNDPIGTYSRSSQAFKTALSVVKDVLSGAVPDPTQGATHYYANTIAQPYWWDSEAPKGAVKIGNHIFGARRAKNETPPTPAIRPPQGYLDVKAGIQETIARWENPEPHPQPRLNRTIFRAPPNTKIPLEQPRMLLSGQQRNAILERHLPQNLVRPGIAGALPAARREAPPLNAVRPTGPVPSNAPRDIGIPPSAYPAAQVGDEVKVSPPVPPPPTRTREPVVVDGRGTDRLTRAQREEQLLLRGSTVVRTMQEPIVVDARGTDRFVTEQRMEQLSERNRKALLIEAAELPASSIPMLSDDAPTVEEWIEENAPKPKPVTRLPNDYDPEFPFGYPGSEPRLKPGAPLDVFQNPDRNILDQRAEQREQRKRAKLGPAAQVAPVPMPAGMRPEEPLVADLDNFEWVEEAAAGIETLVETEPGKKTWFEEITHPGLFHRLAGRRNARVLERLARRALMQQQFQVAGNGMQVKGVGQPNAVATELSLATTNPKTWGSDFRNPANQRPEALSALLDGRTSYTVESGPNAGALMPTTSISGRPRLTYGD